MQYNEGETSSVEALPNDPPAPANEKSPMPVNVPGSLVVVNGRTPRKDRGRLHAVRHGALARHHLEALRHLGEDLKKLRRLERQFRAELRPQGAIADLIFDRFWSSYLRCLLAARAEAKAVLPVEADARKPAPLPILLQADLPTLLIDEDPEAQNLAQTLAPDVLRRLLLVHGMTAISAGRCTGPLPCCLSCARVASPGWSARLLQCWDWRKKGEHCLAPVLARTESNSGCRLARARTAT